MPLLMFLSAPSDIVFSGDYQIQNCGSQATRIAALLDHIWEALQPAIEDSESPGPGKAYFTFFKDVRDAPFVSQVLRNVSVGAQITPQTPSGGPNPFQNRPPLFYCATAPGQLFYTSKISGRIDIYAQCVQNPTGPMFQLQTSPYIVICPIFFTMANLGDLPLDNTCLTVSTYINRFQENGRKLGQYRVWIILEMIVRYYITSKTLTVPEIIDVNKCVRLSSKEASINARSYTYYVACEKPFQIVVYGRLEVAN